MKSKTIDQFKEQIQKDLDEILEVKALKYPKINVTVESKGMVKLKSDFIFGSDLINIIQYLVRKKYRFCLDHGEITLV